MDKTKKILIVDDDEDITITLKMMLDHFGHHVETASNGKDAIDLAASRKYDVILMDVKMPGMSGIDAYRHIKSVDKATNIVFVTGYCSGEEMANIIEERCDVLNKPFEIGDLVSLIEKYKRT